MAIEKRDIKPEWRNAPFAILGSFVGLFLFVICLRWDMLNFQDHLPRMRIGAVLVAILTVLFTAIIYVLFFKLRSKVFSLEECFGDRDKDGKNTHSNSTTNKSMWSGVFLGIFICIGLIFIVYVQSVVVKTDITTHQDQILNMTIYILLLASFTAIFTVIINHFISWIYFKVLILEKMLDGESTNGEDIRLTSSEDRSINRMPTKYIGMFFLGLSSLLVITGGVKLIVHIPIVFLDVLATIPAIRVTVVASTLNAALIHVIGLGIILCILYKLLIVSNKIESKLFKGCPHDIQQELDQDSE